MHRDAPGAPPNEPILTQADAARRLLLLAKLATELAALGVRCVLARNHRLVLRWSAAPCAPSGLTGPELHIFAPSGTTVATTDGHSYTLTSGETCPASTPQEAAALIRRLCESRPADPPALALAVASGHARQEPR